MSTQRGNVARPETLTQRFREAVAAFQGGRSDDAVHHCQAILRANSRHFDALHLLGVLRAQQGDRIEAVNLLRQAIACNPRSAPAHNNLGMTLNLANRHEEAVAPLERAVALNPRDPLAHNNLGIALQGLDLTERAAASFEHAVALKPDYGEALSNLGSAQNTLGRAEEALPLLRRAIALNPRFVEAHVNLGTVFRTLDRRAEARASFDKALALEPRNVLAHVQVAGMNLETGNAAEARRWYELALQIEPNNVRVLCDVMESGKVAADDPNLALLEARARDASALPVYQRLRLHFSLGKAYADNGLHDRSFGHYLEGNALKRRQTEYDEAAELGVFDRISQVFTAEFLQSRAGARNGSDRPIFVLGMMRSGSTLVEQILASHPDVVAGGERRDLNEAYKEVRRTIHLPATYPEVVRLFDAAQVSEIGRCYLKRLEKAAGGKSAARITDKMLGNFSSIGLIRLALPNARIIHTFRDPIDTCLSCFSKLFADKQPFTYDLGELGRYYRAYQTLMDHWRRVLPAGAMLEVRYEDVVADLETQARRIVAYCGLEWNDSCLSFHTNTRPVRTASQLQVRQPLYRSSVGRWRPAPEILRPLLEGLGESLADPPVIVS